MAISGLMLGRAHLGRGDLEAALTLLESGGELVDTATSVSVLAAR